MKKNTSKKGYTLVELLVVIGKLDCSKASDIVGFVSSPNCYSKIKFENCANNGSVYEDLSFDSLAPVVKKANW